jgi:hypothetical protein
MIDYHRKIVSEGYLVFRQGALRGAEATVAWRCYKRAPLADPLGRLA